MILDSIDCAEIDAYLTENKITTILSDVFDTILCRKTHPETIKKIVAARLNDHMDSIPQASFYEARQQAELYCYEKSSETYGDREIYYPELTERIYDQLKATYGAKLFLNKPAFCDIHRRIEMAVEQRSACADPVMAHFLMRQKQSGKKIILLSDFYMQREWVSRLLESQGLAEIFDKLIVSADVFKTKHSGKLYQHIIENGFIDPDKTIMLGDNLHSDVHMAQHYGIKAFHIDRKHQKKFYTTQQKKRTSEKALISDIKQITKPDPEKLFAYFPLLLLHTVHQLYLACLRKGTTDLYFLSREGKIIKTLFDTYQHYLTGNQPSIKTHYLLVSRRSTLAVSLGPLDQEDFHTLFRQYSRISIRQFALSLAFDMEQIAVFCQDLNIDMDETHDHLPSSQPFHLLKNHPEFAAYYEATRIQQKENFLCYFNKLNPLSDEASIYLFDVGWKGTMQDNLAKLFPHRTIHGFYIGLTEAGNAATNEYKTGLLFDYKNIDRTYHFFIENISLFEILLNAEHGSVLRYTRSETAVELDFNANEERVFQHYTRPMQEKILKNFSQLLPLLDKHVMSIHPIGAYGIRQHCYKIYFPNKKELQWFKSIDHFENFGLFNYSKVADYWVPAQSSLKGLVRLKEFFKFYRQGIMYR